MHWHLQSLLIASLAMWTHAQRQSAWSDLDTPWDIIVVGGGITGAGVLAEAARRGLRAVLFEAHDFAFGSSSRSSKMVHGGLRYLRQGQVPTTLVSVRERDALMRDAAGLVQPHGFTLTRFEGDAIPLWLYGVGLMVYDALSMRWRHEKLDVKTLRDRIELLRDAPVLGGYHYEDADTDDVRLVLRVLREANRLSGAVSMNYTRVTSLLRDQNQRVCGVTVEDLSGSGRTAEVRAPVVVNATGAWADWLRTSLGEHKRLRPLRGSHLVFSYKKVPLPHAVAFEHPRNGRAVFVRPWQGVVLVGTTDVEHHDDLDVEPRASLDELEFLLEAAQRVCPSQKLTLDDAMGTWAGIRPIIGTGVTDLSKEPRDHAIWNEHGLVTVTGGKLTMFGAMARSVFKALGSLGQKSGVQRREESLFAPPPIGKWETDLGATGALRIGGYYGPDAADVCALSPENNVVIDGTQAYWMELRWAARNEAVVHLDDLLLRRVRLGMILEDGGFSLLPKIRQLVQQDLGWSDDKWLSEEIRYREIWKKYYGPPMV